MAYTIEFAESVKAHHEALTANQRATVLAKIEVTVGTLRWSAAGVLRCKRGPPATVRILAVKVKERNVVRIGGEEIQL
jgi:hypothetical protein